MIIKGLIEEDLVNYKKPCMVIEFPVCKGFKCDKECGRPVCQNGTLATAPTITITVNNIVKRYLSNDITSAVVLQGLEPFDSWDDVVSFVNIFRSQCDDDIVIYTGYKEEEIEDKIEWLSHHKNIIIKFERFIPDQKSHYDEILGVNLASANQYAKKIS